MNTFGCLFIAVVFMLFLSGLGLGEIAVFIIVLCFIGAGVAAIADRIDSN